MKTPRDSRDRRVSTRMALVFMLLLVVGTIVLQYSVDNAAGSGAGWEKASPLDAGRSMLDLLGGVRQAVAANLWSKTDAVHHEYYGGDITKEQALYPYYWLITRLDPHFTMAYFYASYMLCRFGKIDSGFNLAIEGLRYNPDSAMMQYNLAQIYFFFKKDPAKARYHLLKAIQLTNDGQQKAVSETLLGTIDQVIAGKKKQPEVGSIKQASGLDKQIDKYNEEHGVKE
jgi:tetratricopeptide (TPR) repeat protein